MTAGSRTKILTVGVGGQGVLTIARIIGEAALDRGHNAVVGQLHGMSQRGGSVECTVLLGPGETSFVEPGGADLVLGLEPLETLRARPYMSAETRVVVNRGRVVPFPLAIQGKPYPDLDGVLDQIRQATEHMTVVHGSELLAQQGAPPQCLNMFMLGAMAGMSLLPLTLQELREAMERRTPPRHAETNLAAFDLGAGSV